MKFPKNDLIKLTNISENNVLETPHGVYKVIDGWLERGTGRWHDLEFQIFEFDKITYITSFEVPKTEIQDCEPYDYEEDDIECPEVERIEETIIRWREV